MISVFRTARNQGRRSNSRLGARLGTTSAAAETSLTDTLRVLGIWWRVLAGLLLLATLWSLGAFFVDPRFRVGTLAVEGSHLVSEDQVRALVDVSNHSIFTVNPREIERLLKDSYGCIREVRAVCKMPNRVRITLVERPVALVWESGGRLWWVDPAGEILGETQDSGELLVIYDTTGYAPNPTEHIAGVPWQLAQDIQRALPVIRSLDYVPAQGLTIYVTDREWPVYLGHQGDAGLKVAIMQALVQELGASGTSSVEYLDLRNERRPAFRRR